ncbi:hypothetical protein [Nonomuraea sp. B1E8]|uniref:DUF7507 domain-containing protein n=1 Tax=unclassified Nonomuraea TaxID=2593643 RepID=UPI00325EF01B
MRTLIASLLIVMAALAGAPAARAVAGPIVANCEFETPSYTRVMEGEGPLIRIGFQNNSGRSARVTAKVQASFHYWHETEFYSQLVSPDSGLLFVERNLPPAYGRAMDEERGLRVQLFSSLTGDTPIGTCSTKLKVTQAPDRDKDGLLDKWESHGIDYDDDGTVDLALNAAPYNADPDRKDLFVELDWMRCAMPGYCMRSRELSNAAISQVEAAFARRGITLHVRRSEAITEAQDITFDTKQPGAWDDFDDLRNGNATNKCDGAFGDVLDRIDRNCEAILGAKRLVFRYAVSAHGLSGRGTQSGKAEAGDSTQEIVDVHTLAGMALPGGNDFVITLGRWDSTMITDDGGQVEVEAGTFMHELGHTLGLQHGGVDSINCKPNYLSVMNYTHQFAGAYNPGRLLDYQAQDLRSLEENEGLDEIGAAVPGVGTRRVVYGLAGVPRTTDASLAVDWNGDGANQAGATGDVNHIHFGTDTRSCPASPGQRLRAWNDWEHVNLDFRNSLMFEDGAHKGVLGAGSAEITEEAAEALNPHIDLTAAKSVDKALATPGDSLTYAVTVGNKGPATAGRVWIDDTMPDGTRTGRSVADLPAGGSARHTFTYTVPCTTADGTVLTNTATVSGVNAAGYAESGTLADNTATAASTVRRPALTLEAAAAGSDPATFTLTYRNTGTGPASGAALTATVPAGLYYSPGQGTPPETVTRNPDGTTTLRWDVGAVAAVASRTIAFTTRPSLLLAEGTTVTVPVSLSFGDGGDCPYAAAQATAQTRITLPPATRDPRPLAVWTLFPALRTQEALDRVQATDQRYDTSPTDGTLTRAEFAEAVGLPVLQPRALRAELLATYLNMATRRIHASTAIRTPQSVALGLETVGDAVRHARATLTQPVGVRHITATVLLTEINAGLAERW